MLSLMSRVTAPHAPDTDVSPCSLSLCWPLPPWSFLLGWLQEGGPAAPLPQPPLPQSRAISVLSPVLLHLGGLLPLVAGFTSPCSWTSSGGLSRFKNLPKLCPCPT